MTRSVEAMAAELILAAEQKGVRIDLAYARNYIAARLTLQARPDDAAARETVTHFESLLSTFGRFTLPEADYEKHCAGMEQP
jgi:hypothetical protein